VLLNESHPPEAIEEKTTGKICRRRHVPYANVLLAESYPPETKGENLLGKYAAGDKRRKDCGERTPPGSEAQNSAKKD
jgi:hypothetical protein